MESKTFNSALWEYSSHCNMLLVSDITLAEFAYHVDQVVCSSTLQTTSQWLGLYPSLFSDSNHFFSH